MALTRFFPTQEQYFAKDRVKKNLLEEFREYVLKNTTPKDLVDKILMPYTEAYSILRNQTYESTSGVEDINDILYWLNKIDNYDWMPPAIKFLAEHAHDSAYTLQFMKKLERLTAYLQVTAQDVNRRVSRYKWLLLEMDSKPEHSLNAPLETIELTNNEKKLLWRHYQGKSTLCRPDDVIILFRDWIHLPLTVLPDMMQKFLQLNIFFRRIHRRAANGILHGRIWKTDVTG